MGGCALAAESKSGTGGEKLCALSLEAAGYVIQKSSNLVAYTLKPDMRHWKKLPMAIQVVREGREAGACQYSEQMHTALVE